MEIVLGRILLKLSAQFFRLAIGPIEALPEVDDFLGVLDERMRAQHENTAGKRRANDQVSVRPLVRVRQPEAFS